MLLFGGHFFRGAADQCASSEGWACSAKPERGALAVARNAARSAAIAIGFIWFSRDAAATRTRAAQAARGHPAQRSALRHVLLHAALHNRESRSARFARSLIV